MRLVSATKVMLSLAILSMCSISLSAQTPAPATKTASQFYLEYRVAFEKAKKVEDIIPFMAADQRKQIEATPAKDRVEMFNMIKAFDTTTSVKVLKEDRTAKGATLSVSGVDEDGKKATGTVEILKEGTAWKLGKESWKSGS